MNLALVPHLSTIIIAFEDGTGEVLPLPAGPFHHDGEWYKVSPLLRAGDNVVYLCRAIRPLDNNKEGYMLDN